MYVHTVPDTEFRASLSIYCQKCKIGFTLLTSMTDMPLTWRENKFQNLTFYSYF
jgi:hypothetical protein